MMYRSSTLLVYLTQISCLVKWVCLSDSHLWGYRIPVSPEVLLIQTTLYSSVPGGLTYPDYTVFQCPQRSDLSRLHCELHIVMCGTQCCNDQGAYEHQVTEVLVYTYVCMYVHLHIRTYIRDTVSHVYTHSCSTNPNKQSVHMCVQLCM